MKDRYTLWAANMKRAELNAVKAERDAAQAELTRLRALLASGQCVDLARVTDDALYTAAHEAYVMAGFDHRSDARFAAEFRAWLVEKAGVKS